MFEEIMQEVDLIPFLPKRSKDTLKTLVVEMARQRQELNEMRALILKGSDHASMGSSESEKGRL